MNEPTEEQIKKLWEWCGFKKVDNPTPDVECAYLHPSGGYYSFRGYPSIDLNNLSRYAIPKLRATYRNWKSILLDWIDGFTGDTEKDALALFWAIYKVMEPK